MGDCASLSQATKRMKNNPNGNNTECLSSRCTFVEDSETCCVPGAVWNSGGKCGAFCGGNICPAFCGTGICYGVQGNPRTCLPQDIAGVMGYVAGEVHSAANQTESATAKGALASAEASISPVNLLETGESLWTF